MLPTDAWRSRLRHGPKSAPRSTSFEYEHEFQRASFRRLATPPSRSTYHGRSYQTLSPAVSEVFGVSDYDDQSSTEARNQDFAAKSRPSKNPFAHLYSFFQTMARTVFRLFLFLLWTFLKVVDGVLLQHIRAMALRIVGPLFLITFVLLPLFVILDLASPMTGHHVLRLPASPATSVESAQRSDGQLSHSPDLVHTQVAGDREARLNSGQLQRLEDTLSELLLHFERTLGEIGVLGAQSKHQSVRTDKAHIAASAELNSLRKDLEALQLLVRTHAAEIPSHAAASSELNGFRRDLDALQLLYAAEITSQAATSSEINSLKMGLDALQLEIASRAAVSSEINSIRSDLQALQLLVEMSQRHVARPDFALRSTGASVIPSLTSPTYTLRPSTLPGKILGYFTGIWVLDGRSPVTALDHDIHDGHCWPFGGSYGQLGIVLGSLVYIDAITIDHVAAAVAVGKRISAPKDMEVWAMVEGQDNVAKLEAWRAEMSQGAHEPERPKMLPQLPEFIRIAALQYDMYSPNHIQNFPVDTEIRNLGIDFSVVVLIVKSN
ncbi:hypothetical protein DFH08DRAFT_973318 [Mycena albidolilacea]|uniref:SUN domain-containing protein n=1 Tax=Mycena albidolilacea TaxID=1033008 RepID=A0AAD6Z9C9_9AGAR|nr:hypothetical protein DFH08DRAFT_973318 [Mycena albidolilacea]